MAQIKEKWNAEILISEYDKLKSEQIHRLGFRDNLIYANLIAITGILSIVTVDMNRIFALLALPMFCSVLGWTYLVNDEKISAIGRYIRYSLSVKIQEATKVKAQDIFGWESAHRFDKRRMSRKIIQLVVDELVFVVPSIIAILIFLENTASALLQWRWIAVADALFVFVLATQIFIYADLRKDKPEE